MIKLSSTTKNKNIISRQIIGGYKIVGEKTVTAKQREWIKNKLAIIVSTNNFTAEDLKIYKNMAEVRMNMRSLAQHDTDTENRCMPKEELRNLLLAEIFHETSLQQVG